MMKKLKSPINIKSARIILYSNYAKKNPKDKIVAYLKQYGTLTIEDIENLKISGEAIGELIRLCQSEWRLIPEKCRARNDEDKPNIKCDLCDQPNLENLYFVRNKLTKKEMCIGSTCVQEYGVKKANANTAINKYSAEVLIAEHLPNLNEFLRKNRKLPNKYYLISSNYIQQWSKQIENLKKTKNKLEQKPNSQVLEQCKKEWDNTIKLEEEIESYLNNIQHLEMFPGKEIVEWVQKSDEKERLIELIRKNRGLIGKNTFSKIWESDYIRKLLTKIQQKHDWIEISPTNENATNIKFKLIELRAYAATLTLHIQDFLEAFAESIFDEKYNARNIENELIENSKFTKDLYIKILLFFEGQLEKHGYTIIEDTFDTNKLILLKKGIHYVINGEKFSNKVKLYYLNQERDHEDIKVELPSIVSESTENRLDKDQWEAKLDLENSRDELIRNDISR